MKRHQEITIGCPVLAIDTMDAASLQKHGKDAHNTQIIAPTSMLQGSADPEEED